MKLDPTPERMRETALRDLLRAADPLGSEPAGEERDWNRIRPRIAARLAAAERAPGARRFSFAAPAFVLATLVAVAWLGVRFVARPRGADPAERAPAERTSVAPTAAVQAGSSALGSGGGEGESRQIQFETAGGTRVIWVLDPRFAL